MHTTPRGRHHHGCPLMRPPRVRAHPSWGRGVVMRGVPFPIPRTLSWHPTSPRTLSWHPILWMPTDGTPEGQGPPLMGTGGGNERWTIP